MKWANKPDEHDYKAARDYLSLIRPPHVARDLADHLACGDDVARKAKDILRASRLKLLPIYNVHVAQDIRRIRAQEPLSPVLLVATHGRLVIADGYHRVCAAYHVSEDADIHCRLIWED